MSAPHATGPAPAGADGTVLVTVVAGRHTHLAAQRTHVTAARPGIRHVVVAMGDPAVRDVAPGADVVDVPAGDALPLAHARNVGVDRALALGADLVVLLDVDCLPGPGMLERYEAARRDDALLCGPVTYLPREAGAPPVGALAPWRSPHPARPDPPAGTVVTGGDHRLFWSLSFALTPATWRRLGGFCTDYTGYGGEDTDVAFTARDRGIDVAWVGGADAYHQWHPVSSPPREHVADIVRNATTFHARWGQWPMEGWLTALADEGLVRQDAAGWHLTAAGADVAAASRH